MKQWQASLASLIALLFTNGCAYHGAVYSEYSQFGLDIRSTAESSAPIKLGLGYDRGVVAYVPKLKGKTGESCSIISWQDLGSTIAPAQRGTTSVLRVDAGFISGTAATVASAPSDATVIIKPGPESGARSLQLKTTKGPGERIATALSFAPATVRVVPPELQNRRAALARVLGGLDGARANRVLQAAGFPAVSDDQAIAALQDRILAAQTEEEVKKLEDAFRTVP